MEVGMWVGVEVVVLCKSGVGGNDQKTDLKVMFIDNTEGELEERSDVTHSRACEEGHVRF